MRQLVRGSHQDLHYLLFFFYFVTTLFDILLPIFVYATSLIDILDTFDIIEGRIHFRNSVVKRLNSCNENRAEAKGTSAEREWINFQGRN